MNGRSTLLVRAAAAGALAVAGATAVLAVSPGTARHSQAAGDAFVGQADPASVLHFSVVLRLPGERRLAAAVGPSARGQRRPIGPTGFGRRFGLPLPTIARLERRLEGAGLHVTSSYPQRTALEVRARIADVARLFHVRFGAYRAPDGRRYTAPLGRAHIPARLSGAVVGVAGLSNRPIAKTVAIPNAGQGLKPTELAAAYDVAPLWRMGLNGAGQTVAIVSAAPFDDRDVKAFDQVAGATGPPVYHCAPGSARRLRCDLRHRKVDFESNPASIEDALDVDAVRGMAPKARILNYEDESLLKTGSFVTWVGKAIDQITRDGRASIISISYGDCDVSRFRDGSPGVLPPDRLRVERALKAAVAGGINVFVSSGDSGAYTCQRFDLGDQRPTAAWPGDSPWVISVGGTLLSVRQDGSYLEEAGWEDILENTGGGGGLNPRDPRPAWQKGPGVLNRDSNGGRQLPDVAGPADPDSGVYVFAGGIGGSVGGTSAAAPFWAGTTALVSQLVKREARGRLPYLNPVFYELAATPGGSPPFHDVVRGGDRLHLATRGWDYATGLGSPDAANLANAVVEFVKKHPAR